MPPPPGRRVRWRRNVPFALFAGALALGYAVARRVLGGWTALGALALTVGSPLALAHARPAHYIAASVLHGALCLWLLVRWLDAPSRARGLVLGAALLSIDSQELINTVALAMRHQVTASELRDAIYTHPSSTEAFNEVLQAP